ncbi:MAG: CyaY protein [Candidatus Azotimanducaceae bacterium]
MQDNEYSDRVDTIFTTLEDQLDEHPADLDVEVSGSVMTIIFPNQSQVILSRQIANQEIWVAAKSGGFHLHLDVNDSWQCRTTGEDLAALLSRAFTEQLSESVTLVV